MKLVHHFFANLAIVCLGSTVFGQGYLPAPAMQNQAVPEYYNTQRTQNGMWQTNQAVQQQQAAAHQMQQQQLLAPRYANPNVAYQQPAPVQYAPQQPMVPQRHPAAMQSQMQEAPRYVPANNASYRPNVAPAYQMPVAYSAPQAAIPPQASNLQSPIQQAPQLESIQAPQAQPLVDQNYNGGYANWDPTTEGSCDSCGQVDNCCGCFCPTWFAYAGTLIMDRDDEREVWLSNDAGNIADQTLGTYDAAMDWSVGYEFRIGKRFCCCNWAAELVYWGVDDSSERTVDADFLIGALDTPLEVNFQGLSYDDGLGGGVQNITVFYNDAEIHRLRRNYEFHNLELNVFQDTNLYSGYACGSNFRLGMLAGFRFFKFDDAFTFSSDPTNEIFSGEASEVHYDVDVDNNLYGAQLGFNGVFDHGGHLSFYFGTKFGVYGNQMEHRSRVFGSNGYAVIDNALSPNDGEEFNINSSKSDISFLGELDLGARFRVTRCFSVRGGYRAVAVTGVALSTDQIPQNFEDLGLIASIQSSGEVVLHGAYFGGEFIW